MWWGNLKMTSKNESVVLPREVVARCWCSRSRRRFGLVFELSGDGHWELRHSYAVSDSYEEPESTKTVIKGPVTIRENYNGCKWCGDHSVFQCGHCKAFNCQAHAEGGRVRCANCGTSGVVAGEITSFSSAND